MLWKNRDLDDGCNSMKTPKMILDKSLLKLSQEHDDAQDEVNMCLCVRAPWHETNE